MNLKHWAEVNHWLKPHRTSTQEIERMLAIVKRDLRDAEDGTVSADWRFGIAYNAALKLCTILLYASGYKPAMPGLAHSKTLAALPLILGANHQADADYLDSCLKRRNVVEYDHIGGASETDAQELIEYIQGLQVEVLSWLRANHPELLSKPSPGKK